MALGAPELLILLVVVLVLFGGAKLPKLAKSLGEAQREFKQGTDGEPAPPAVAQPVAPVAAQPVAARTSTDA